MQDLDKALADITSIRSQLVAGALFRGLGPTVVAFSGCMALAVTVAQLTWPTHLSATHARFLSCWIFTAVIAVILIGAEMLARCRRHHGGLADAMLVKASELFLPSGIAGSIVAIILFKFSPLTLWLLPGLWQILLALGLFSTTQFLPRSIIFVAVWYFVAGACVLTATCLSRDLSPWMMGIPFSIGQFLMAAVLYFAGDSHAE